MTLTQAIEKVEKIKALYIVTDGAKSDRTEALCMLLEIAKAHERKGEG